MANPASTACLIGCLGFAGWVAQAHHTLRAGHAVSKRYESVYRGDSSTAALGGFMGYKALEPGKWVRIQGWAGGEDACAIINKSIAAAGGGY